MKSQSKPNFEPPDKQIITPAKDDSKPPLENITTENIPKLERKLMFLPKLTPDKITLLQKQDPFCNNILTFLH